MDHNDLEQKLTMLLAGTNALAGYPLSLVCTEQGLLIASSGEEVTAEIAAGLTSLFNDIVLRADRDLGMSQVDELTLLDGGDRRIIIRPLPLHSDPRLYLVLTAPKKASWRQNTNTLTKRVSALVAPLYAVEPEEDGED